MHTKRYQVFISSTYEDLKAERRAVQDVVISTGDFPVQMESFPATSEDQFQFIKSLIDQCDYYILIIAGRYGAVAEDGLSYTHKEFRYALEKDIPVLVMLHAERESISVGKSENTDNARHLLDEFIKEAETGRLRKTWNSVDSLKLAVREALEHAKATNPRVGWVRGDSVASVYALKELDKLRRENDEYRKTLGDLQIDIPLPDLPAPNSRTEVVLQPNFHNGLTGSYASIAADWISLFPLFQTSLDWHTSDWDGEYMYNINREKSQINLGSSIAALFGPIDTSKYFKVSPTSFEQLESYYIEAGLLNAERSERPFTDAAEKLGRRHRISNHQPNNFEITSGKIEISQPSVGWGNDDEIPF